MRDLAFVFLQVKPKSAELETFETYFARDSPALSSERSSAPEATSIWAPQNGKMPTTASVYFGILEVLKWRVFQQFILNWIFIVVAVIYNNDFGKCLITDVIRT